MPKLDSSSDEFRAAGHKLVDWIADYLGGGVESHDVLSRVKPGDIEKSFADAPSNITTDADRQAQEIILKSLLERFPGDAFCAEEATPTVADARKEGPRLWIVDPIDGTRGFARKTG